jgi:hypothetical protein
MFTGTYVIGQTSNSLPREPAFVSSAYAKCISHPGLNQEHYTELHSDCS